MATTNTRKPRSDKGKTTITSRDLVVLRWIGEQYAVRLDHLQRLLALLAGRQTKEEGRVSRNAALDVIERWKKLNYIESEQLVQGHPRWVWLSRKGLQAMQLEFAYWKPKPGELEHIRFVNEVRMYLEQRRPQATFISERALKKGRSTRAGVELSWSKERGHLPDAEFVVDGECVAVEVELSAKGFARTVGIMEQLATDYQTVWYFVKPEIRPLIERSREALSEEMQEQILVYSLEGLPD